MAFLPANALAIRDAAFDRLFPLMVNGVAVKSGRKAPITTVPAQSQLPALGVFIINDKETKDGDTVFPRFRTDLELGISWVVMASDEMLIDGSLDSFVVSAKNALLQDTAFLEMFEFAEGSSREYVFNRQGESYTAEIRLRMNFSYHTDYEPIAPYDFLLLDVKTESEAGTPIIEVQIPQESQILNPPENLR